MVSAGRVLPVEVVMDPSNEVNYVSSEKGRGEVNCEFMTRI
jgi:hypothetical protein